MKKIIYKEKVGNKRIIHILGIKFTYTKKHSLNHYKSKADFFEQQYNFLKSIVDITKLKSVTGSLRQLQLDDLEFSAKIIDIIEKNNLSYFLMFGNLLGAVRHKGFIPWDDDFDVGMMRLDYEKFKRYCKKEFIYIDQSDLNCNSKDYLEKYILRLDEYMKKYPNKIYFREANSLLQIVTGNDARNYLNFDIFVYDYIDGKYSVEEYKEWANSVHEKMRSIPGEKDQVIFMDQERKKNKHILKEGNKIFPGIDNMDINDTKSKVFYDKSLIFPLKDVIFENKIFKAPNNIDALLKASYGDYMQFPDNICLNHHTGNQFNALEEKNKNL